MNDTCSSIIFRVLAPWGIGEGPKGQIQSNLSYPNIDYPNYWVIRRRRTVQTFFSIIYCNKTTNYSNFDYPKNSIFPSDLAVPIKGIAIKLPFKIRSPNVTHGYHDFFVWLNSIYTPE